MIWLVKLANCMTSLILRAVCNLVPYSERVVTTLPDKIYSTCNLNLSVFMY